MLPSLHTWEKEIQLLATKEDLAEYGHMLEYHKVSIKLQNSWHVVIYILWDYHIVLDVQ